jgi:hypothetical protein
MERIPIDLAPEQIVRWLLDEERRDAFDLLVNATRSYRVGAMSEEERASLDDTKDGELGEISEVGHLEVRPRREPHRWVLRVRIEDDIGPRLPEDETVPENEEDIDLSTFFEEFVAPSRGIADVSAEVEGPTAKASLDHILREMTTDWHKRKGRHEASRHRERRG